METDHYQRQENRRDEKTGLIVERAHKGDLRNEVLMLGFLHPRPEEHQEAGHEHKHGQKREQHGFNQVDRHIRADLKLHEHHGDQAADGGQAAGADFRNALAQGGDGRLPDGQTVLPLLLEPVAQNDRVVQGQRQLQNAGHGIGHEGNGTHQELAALIENHGGHEGHQQHRHLRIGLGGQHQHNHDDNRDDHHDEVYLLLDDLRGGIAQVGFHIVVLGGKGILHRFQAVQALGVLFAVVEGDGIQGGNIPVVVLFLIVDALDALDLLQLIADGLSPLPGHVFHHHLGRAVGNELLVHQIQTLPGLGMIRQIGLQIVFHRDPVPGDSGKNQADHQHQKEKIPLIHNEGGKLHHGIGLVVLIFGSHGASLLSRSCSYRLLLSYSSSKNTRSLIDNCTQR